MFTRRYSFDFKERERLIEDYIIREFHENEKLKIKMLSERLSWPVETIRKYVRNLIKRQEIIRNDTFYSLTTDGEKRVDSMQWAKANKEKTIIVIKDGKKMLNLSALIPEYYNGNKVYLESNGEFIRIWYKSSGRGNSPNPFISKKLISLDDKLWINLGLIYGDGRTSMSEACAFTFTNKEPELVKTILDFLEDCFGIARKNVSWHTNLNTDMKNNHEYINECEKNWQDYCGLEKEKIRNISWSDKVKAKYGIVHINYFNSSFRMIIQTLVESIQKYAEVVSEFSIPYIKGLIAAEGSVILKRKTGGLDSISIGNISQDGLRHFSSCLSCIGIDNSIKVKEIRIHGWRNFLKIQRFGLTDLYPEKRAKFESGLANSLKTVRLYRLKYFSKPITSLDFANLLGYSTRDSAVQIIIKKFIRQGFLARKRNGKSYFYQLTPKGNYLMNFLPKHEINKNYNVPKRITEKQKKLLCFLGNNKFSTKEISFNMGLSDSYTRTYLGELKRRGLVFSKEFGKEKVWCVNA